MQTYRIQKKQKNNTYVVLKMGEKRSRLVNGDLPLVYPNMFIALDVDKYGTIVGSRLNIDNATNQKVLMHNGWELAKYAEVYERYENLRPFGYSWKVAEEAGKDLYGALSFVDADKIHRNVVNRPTDEARIKGINKAIIKRARQRRKIAYSLEEYLSLYNEIESEGAYSPLPYTTKILGLSDTAFTYLRETVYDTELLDVEKDVKRCIIRHRESARELVDERVIGTFLIEETSLDLDQQKAVWCLKDTSPCIITGGAGVGKTSMVEALIRCYSSVYDKKDILLVAPTGKASRRLEDKTKHKASTIHTALRLSPEDDYAYYKKGNPLPHKLIIVDESSMIDTCLMFDLLNALTDGAKIVFVGDHNQLYPVGYGEPFFDFFDMIPVHYLTINHRQDEDSDILDIANAVLRGKPIKDGRGVKVQHIEEKDIYQFVEDNENIQYLSPYNEVNARINRVLKKGDKPFNKGDKIIFLRNTKEYCNGDIGFITTVLPDEYLVKMDGRILSVEKKHERDMMLAYSITIHKMQGSEGDSIILFLPQDTKFVDRRMLYTAVTRARKDLSVYYYTRHGRVTQTNLSHEW